jgi:DNA-binding transcriptional LysR family regulator
MLLMLRQLSFNLLRVLEILLEEQNVTAAAIRLNLSQSAVSKHLARLREIFDDQLFDRTAQGLKPTPRAKELAPPLRQILQQMEQITRPAAFDPSLSRRRFSIDVLETAYSLTFPLFMPGLLKQASNIRINTQTWSKDSLDKLLGCELDLAIACREWDERSPLHMQYLPQELSYVELIQDHPVCLVREGHPATTEEWHLDTFLKYRHLQVTFGGMSRWLLDDVLNMANKSRDVAVDMPDFHSAMSLCEQSDLILCVPSKHAAKMAKHFKLKTLSVPVEMAPGVYLLLWNKHFDKDTGHQWIRDLIVKSVGEGVIRGSKPPLS